MEPQALQPAWQNSEGRSKGSTKPEAGGDGAEVRRSERTRQRQRGAVDLTPGAAEEKEKTRTLRSGGKTVSSKSSSDKCKKLQRSASVGVLPDVTAVRGEGTLCGKKQGGVKAVSQSPVRKLHLPASPVSLASGSQIRLNDCDGNAGVNAVSYSPVNKELDHPGFPASPVSRDSGSQIIASDCDVVPETPHDVCTARESTFGKGKAAADSAGNDTPAPSPAINPVAAKSAPDPACNTDISDDEFQFSCESAPASGASAALVVRAKQPPKFPTAESPPVPCPEDIPTIINQLTQAYNEKKKKEAEIVAQQKLIRAANKNKRGRLELDMIALKGELFEVEVSIERLLTKAGPWRERFENMERFEKMQKSLKQQVPYRTRKPSTTSCSASSDTEGEFKKPEAPSRSLKRAPPKGRGSETIDWQHMAFDVKDVDEQEKEKQDLKTYPQVTSVTPKSFILTQEEFPPLSPGVRQQEPSQSQRPQEDVIPAMEVSSNQSAASGVSGVVHGDESGVNAGVSVAVLGEASAHSDPVVMGAQEVLVMGNKESGNTGHKKVQQAHGTEGQKSTEQATSSGDPRASSSGVDPKASSCGVDPKASSSGVDPKASGRFWEKRRLFPAGEGPSFGGQAFRRKNCFKLMWEGNIENAPKRTYIIRRLLEGSAKFKASTDLEACIVQSATEWDVSFKIPQGLDAFWRLFETLKTQPEWQNFEAMPISKPEIKNITIIVKNEGVPVDDVLTWLKRQCTVLSPLARVLEDDVWTGGWKTEVKLTVINNIPQHLPNTFFIGKEKCICFYAGQAKRCFKCGSLNHLASSYAVEKCILCGKIGHTKRFCKDIKCNLCGNMGHPHRLCPMASHNKNRNSLVVENQVVQEEDQLLIEAVHEIENQQREEQQQRHEGTKPNQLQQRERREDQDGAGRKVQHQRGQTPTHREVDQRSSPQPCPSGATKGLSQTMIGPIIAPDPDPQTHPPGTASPEPTQCISETPVSVSEESPYKKKKKKRKENLNILCKNHNPQQKKTGK
ncbi:hypothetical protein XELAEV_18046949mg [Xenopus laevis]|uniref:CCHC-type domain-containing protein n=1 Tax=Xenopus laevis TaxID=8355 RepID=A0A974BUA1_XENLA|nr:hypothetical protein XELAEV_18046949mg [Xenopus laevis]